MSAIGAVADSPLTVAWCRCACPKLRPAHRRGFGVSTGERGYTVAPAGLAASDGELLDGGSPEVEVAWIEARDVRKSHPVKNLNDPGSHFEHVLRSQVLKGAV